MLLVVRAGAWAGCAHVALRVNSGSSEPARWRRHRDGAGSRGARGARAPPRATSTGGRCWPGGLRAPVGILAAGRSVEPGPPSPPRIRGGRPLSLAESEAHVAQSLRPSRWTRRVRGGIVWLAYLPSGGHGVAGSGRCGPGPTALHVVWWLRRTLRSATPVRIFAASRGPRFGRRSQVGHSAPGLRWGATLGV